MSDLPQRPPPGLPPLPPGWTEHKAPTGHTYYYNKETKKSTYVRPTADVRTFHSQPPPPIPQPPRGAEANLDLFNPIAAQTPFNTTPQPTGFQFSDTQERHRAPGTQHQHQNQNQRPGPPLSAHNNNTFPSRRRPPEDRPKHRHDIPNCAPWVLVQTKLGRRFVWNKATNESFWKFPPDVMAAVLEFDRREREKRERRARGEPSSDEEDEVMAEVDELAAAEAGIQKDIGEVEGEVDMDGSEYEEVEVTDDSDAGAESPRVSKRARTAEPAPDEPPEMGEEDIAWQLAQMEALEAEYDHEGGMYDDDDEEEGLPLTHEDCQALFCELLDDLHINPYTPWETVLDNEQLYTDPRYKALPTMKSRKETFSTWSKSRIALLQRQKQQTQTSTPTDPKIPYLSFLQTHATPKLYWPEFRRKHRKEDVLRSTKLSDKEKEKLYREHVKRLSLPTAQLKSDLADLLKSAPLRDLNRDSTIATIPVAVLKDLRFYGLEPGMRDKLVEAFIETLPPPPSETTDPQDVELEMEKIADRERREKALAERERRVAEEKRRTERDVREGKHRLREEEEVVERAMRVGKEGLRGYFEGES